MFVLCVFVCVRVCVCVRACVHACVHACVCAPYSKYAKSPIRPLHYLWSLSPNNTYECAMNLQFIPLPSQ